MLRISILTRPKAHLAAIYCIQGRWDEVAKLELQVVEARSSLLGVKHPAMRIAMANLASTYSRQGRSRDAEELWVRVRQTGFFFAWSESESPRVLI